jgi:hypothetical protein
MDGGWRTETTGALVCIAMLPPWVCITGLNLESFWLVVFSVIIGVGVGCGLAGLRHGSWTSRVISGLCLVVLLLVGIGFAVSVRFDPWLYP